MTQLNRREFVTAVACAACLCGWGPAPNFWPITPRPAPRATLDVGLKSDYATNGITLTWAKLPNRISVVATMARFMHQQPFALTEVERSTGSLT